MTDLDARVAALMRKVAYYRYAPIEVADKKIMELEQAIRAELQKPALHEPIADEEITLALNIANGRLPNGAGQRSRMRRALESFLQGRAKPVEEEITDAESKKWLLRSAKAEALLRRVHRLMPIFEKGIRQLTFTAEAGGKIYAELRAIQLELSGHTEGSWTEAAIRASKGEKT